MDGEHHIVICQYYNELKPDKPKGCGHVVGTSSLVELVAMLATSADVISRQRHATHVRSGKLPKNCPHCDRAYRNGMAATL